MTNSEAGGSKDRKLARSLIAAQDRERRRIARELHDGLSQELAVIGLGFKEFERSLDLDRDSRARLVGLIGRVDRIAARVRSLSHSLHPAVLDFLGLAPALASLCEELAEHHGFSVERAIELGGDEELPLPVKHELFRIVQEALANVMRHAGVSTARLALTRQEGWVRLTVTDEGRGFDASAARSQAGLGLVSMNERALAIGGELRIRTGPGRGTELEVLAPAPGVPCGTFR